MEKEQMELQAARVEHLESESRSNVVSQSSEQEESKVQDEPEVIELD